MKQISIRIANRTVQVAYNHEALKEFCREYLTADGTQADAAIRIEPEMLAEERRKSIRNAEKEGTPVVTYPDAEYEITAANRLVAEALIDFDILLMHGSAVAVGQQAFIFTAKSGTGKSTHVSFWKELLGDQAVVVNDDKPFLEINSGGVTVHGSPWCGKEGKNTNCSVPLRAICMLRRGRENRIQELSFEEALPSLMSQIYRPQKPLLMSRTMELIGQMRDSVRFYWLECLPQRQAAALAYGTLYEVGE